MISVILNSCETVSLMSVPNPVALDILHIDMLHDMLHDMSPSSLVSLLVQSTKVSTIGDGQQNRCS